MIQETIRIPRWRAIVLCLAGVLAMTKPLASGISLYRATLPAPVKNYSALYGWVEESGPYNTNERWRAEQRLRVLGYPREHFTAAELDQAAADVRNLGLAEIQRLKIEENEKSARALADRAVAGVMAACGAGGILFYLYLAYTLIHDPAAPRDPRVTWLGKRKRHGRITFGAQAM
jgi:hypothetical protein